LDACDVITVLLLHHALRTKPNSPEIFMKIHSQFNGKENPTQGSNKKRKENEVFPNKSLFFVP